MKIAAKINMALLTTIVGFAAAAGLLVYAANMSTRLSSLSLQATSVVEEAYSLNGATQDILTTSDSLSSALTSFNSALKAFQDAFNGLEQHPDLGLLGPDLQQEVTSAQTAWSLVLPDFQRVAPAVNAILAANTATVGKKQGILLMVNAALQARSNAGGKALDVNSLENAARSIETPRASFIVGILDGLSAKIEAQKRAVTSRSMTVAIAVSSLVMIFSIVFMLVFGRNLAGRVRSIETVMRRIAAKDMTVRMKARSRDEIGALANHVNNMLDSLAAFFGTVRGATVKVDELKDTISSGSTESAASLNQITKNIESMKDQFFRLDKNVATTTDAIMNIGGQISELSDDIAKQSSFITNTSSSIEEMNASVQSVARLSEDRKRRADKLTEVIKQGGERIGIANDHIRSVTREIDDILEIIEIINSVSEQTNLLSMNAAIESAHAGEAGKGFAVVADEIRKLAESTSENAARIDRSLKSITDKIKEALDASDLSFRNFENINQDVHDFAGAMNEISNNMNELSAGSQEILQAANEIADITSAIKQRSDSMDSGAHEIQSAMQDVRDISTGVVGGMEEIDHGVKEILASLVDISDKTGESRERMEALTAILNSFRANTEEEVEADERPSGTEVVEWSEANTDLNTPQ